MREIRNLEAAERLVKKYRSITREELAKVYASICEEESNEMQDVLQEITGFGSLSKCSLCTAIVENNIQYRACPYCIYQNFRDFAAPCVYHETYEAIEKSKNLDELMEAIRNRADYLEELIEKVKNDN